ncbi:MAG: hypothetical protein ACPHQ9_01940 [Marinobacter sp.]|uniref:hypothetical protein n=1 Tax=Marinobacter sp. TaxID=50741 RepID=UPI003C506083
MTLRIGITLIVSLALTGCFSGSSSNNAPDQDPRISVDYTTFVKNEIKQTSATRAPVNINPLEFRFNDQDNEQAFDDLF